MVKKMTQLTLGADPEVFLIRNGIYISSIGKIGGTKEKPKKFGKGYNVHEDNVAVEYNIPPSTEPQEWVAHNMVAMDYIKEIAAQHGCELAIVSDAHFTDDELDNPKAREFGCNPDFNAWTLDVNPSPDARQTNLRTAGGHIHIGYAGLDIRQKFELVRALDIFLGIPLALLDPTSRRTELYGHLGACRPKKYGVEYRVPSNIWLSDPQFIFDIFDTVTGIVAHAEDYITLAEQAREQVEAIPVGSLGQFNNLDIFNTIKTNMPTHSESVYKGILERV